MSAQKTFWRNALYSALVAASVVTCTVSNVDAASPPGAQLPGGSVKLSTAEIESLARDLYYYAYPIVLMDTTMRQATNVLDAASVRMRAPVNQFAHFRTYPKADAHDVVRFNFDTLYSLAWVDLSHGPVILSVPDTHGR
jgi:hypothetical protein